MLIGYARVSTLDQNPDLQIDALAKAGCEKIFTEHASGGAQSRPRLDEALDFLRDRAGDVLVVWKLDRLARSLPHLISVNSHPNVTPFSRPILTPHLGEEWAYPRSA